MNDRSRFIIPLIIAAIVFGFLYSSQDLQPATNMKIANEAENFCIERGGTLNILQTDGGSYGVCTIGGQDCEVWSHLRGECPG